MKWKYRNKILDHVPPDCEAFVYYLEFNDGTRYIGKKNFFSTRRVKVKGRLRRRVETKESDWRIYNSSSKLVKEKLANGSILKQRKIIYLCKTKAAATWYELVTMIQHRVLCDDTYLNKNILARFFKCFENEIVGGKL